MDASGAGRLNRSSPSCLNRSAQRIDFFHGLLAAAAIVSTAYYLQFVEPLAVAASARFADHCGDLITGPIGAGGAR